MSDTDLLVKYFPDLNSFQTEQFRRFAELFIEWNTMVNMISRKDIEHLFERHILHSLGIAKVIQFKKGSKVLDIGTGGGFPGIPLAIMFPDVDFILVDSIGKKIKVVNDIADKMQLKNVVGIHERAENVQGQFDFIVSRAVTRLNKFIPWTKGKMRKKNINELPNGLLYLKGGDLTEELSEIKKKSQLFDLKEFYYEDFFETKKVVYLSL